MRKTNSDSRAPIKYNHKLNFNGTSVAPEIPSIRKYADQLIQEYQKQVPGSESASRYLLLIANQSRDLIRKLLLKPHLKDEFTVEFFSGTGRAMDVAVARIPGPKRIIISPFEHPTVIKVARWHTKISCAEVCEIVFDRNDFYISQEEQGDRIVEQAKAYIKQDSRTAVLILSEVCYATGMITPYENIIKRIRDGCENAAIKVIIDGAHAAGNGHFLNRLDDCDSYVFSAHKWLLSSEPCGIMLSRQLASEDMTPYDAWSQNLPSTTANVRLVAGILASLTVLCNVGFETIWAHSRKLRRHFLKRMCSNFMVIGKDSGPETSLMLAICPRPGKQWKYDSIKLREYLQQNSVYVLVLTVDPCVPWVRMAFPCFIELEQLDVLCRILEDAIAD